MRRALIVLAAVLAASCSGSSTAPSSPSPAPLAPSVTVTPAPNVPVAAPVVHGPQFSQIFWDEFVHNSYDAPMAHVSLTRLLAAPRLYLKTVDEAGVAIDAVTLQTVEDAMVGVASTWGGGQFGLAGVQRGTGTMAHQHGWITVVWPATDAGAFCGFSDVGTDGGVIQLNYKTPSAGCRCNGSQIRPRTARHELGHAFGYWHTDSQSDLMSGPGVAGCDQLPSPREIYHATVAYQSAVGTEDRLRAPIQIID